MPKFGRAPYWRRRQKTEYGKDPLEASFSPSGLKATGYLRPLFISTTFEETVSTLPQALGTTSLGTLTTGVSGGGGAPDAPSGLEFT